MILKGFQQKEIFVREWIPEEPEAIIVIVHGFKDHSNRYSCLGEWFVNKNIAVFGIDLRGQGMTGGTADGYGIIESPDGWIKMRNDVDILIDKIKESFPERKIFLLGHSMGSMLVRDYMNHHREKVAGILLSGTTQQPYISMKAGAILTNIISMLNNPEHKSPFLEKMIYGPYQKSVKNARVKRDWLSRDDKRVDWIANDELSQGRLSVEYYREFFQSVIRIEKEEKRIKSKIRIKLENGNVWNNIPIFIYCGDRDPVGDFGKHSTSLYNAFKENGLTNVTLKIYKDARHEMHNEINRNEVFDDILSWMKGITKIIIAD